MGRELKKYKSGKYAVVETVSGMENPVTPKFKTKQEVAEYLHQYGEFFGGEPIEKEIAEQFIKVGWVPSMITNSKGVLVNYECVKELKEKGKK